MLIERLRFTSLSRIFRRKIVVMIIWGIRSQASERIMNCWGRNICRVWSADRRIYDSITIKCKQQNQKKSPGSTMKRSWNFIGGAVWNASISGTATVRRAGLEPAVSCVSDRCSNHLNYLRCFRKESNLHQEINGRSFCRWTTRAHRAERRNKTPFCRRKDSHLPPLCLGGRCSVLSYSFKERIAVGVFIQDAVCPVRSSMEFHSHFNLAFRSRQRAPIAQWLLWETHPEFRWKHLWEQGAL